MNREIRRSNIFLRVDEEGDGVPGTTLLDFWVQNYTALSVYHTLPRDESLALFMRVFNQWSVGKSLDARQFWDAMYCIFERLNVVGDFRQL